MEDVYGTQLSFLAVLIGEVQLIYVCACVHAYIYHKHTYMHTSYYMCACVRMRVRSYLRMDASSHAGTCAPTSCPQSTTIAFGSFQKAHSAAMFITGLGP